VSPVDQPGNSRPENPEGFARDFPDDEIELKFQLVNTPMPQFLSETIDVLRSSLPINVVPVRRIEGGRYHYDYYAANDHGVYQPAFVIWHGPGGLQTIRRRSSTRHFPVPNQGSRCIVSRRHEQRQVVKHDLTEDDKSDLMRWASESFHAEVIPLPLLRRTVHPVAIQNVNSKRFFAICLDYSEFEGRQMCQLEIEYGGGIPGVTPDFGNLEAVLREFALMSEILLTSQLGQSLTPTTLTKFEWIVQVLEEQGKRG
jgi:hypothetical protein